jgi:hypothetical protein
MLEGVVFIFFFQILYFLKNTIFRDITAYRLVGIWLRFRGIYWLQRQGQNALSKQAII